MSKGKKIKKAKKPKECIKTMTLILIDILFLVMYLVMLWAEECKIVIPYHFVLLYYLLVFIFCSIFMKILSGVLTYNKLSQCNCIIIHLLYVFLPICLLFQYFQYIQINNKHSIYDIVAVILATAIVDNFIFYFQLRNTAKKANDKEKIKTIINNIKIIKYSHTLIFTIITIIYTAFDLYINNTDKNSIMLFIREIDIIELKKLGIIIYLTCICPLLLLRVVYDKIDCKIETDSTSKADTENIEYNKTFSGIVSINITKKKGDQQQ